MTKDSLEESIKDFSSLFLSIEKELSKVIVGNKEILRGLLAAVCVGGNVLLEGAPGLGKTLLVKTLAQILGLTYKRIQFTPDLMPSDVIGTQMLADDDQGVRDLVFRPGPLFSQIVLADEINRATPKTQSALLEAMEEKQVTVFDETYSLPSPFFVLATQNPIELEGTYPLPEAQLDRFLMKLLVHAPTGEELKEVLQRTTGTAISLASPLSIKADKIIGLRGVVRSVYVAEPLLDIVVRIVAALTPRSAFATEKVNQYVRFGPGPRGAQAILLVAKVFALLDERINVSFDDIRAAILPTLRHRLILTYQAEAEQVTADDLLNEIKTAR
jgi:MoxR-like ATPase